jgi:uracil-DNA glycosylase
MAWGTPAGKRVQKVDKQKHLVLQSVHPSPLSASRGFFECGHFRKANKWLVERYGPEGEIDWALTPGSTTKEIPAPATEARGEKFADEAEAKAQDAKEKVEAAKTEEVHKESAENNEFGSDDEEALEEVLRQSQSKK